MPEQLKITKKPTRDLKKGLSVPIVRSTNDHAHKKDLFWLFEQNIKVEFNRSLAYLHIGDRVYQETILYAQKAGFWGRLWGDTWDSRIMLSRTDGFHRIDLTDSAWFVLGNFIRKEIKPRYDAWLAAEDEAEKSLDVRMVVPQDPVTAHLYPTPSDAQHE